MAIESVTLNFHDASANPVPTTTFEIVGIATLVTDTSGSIVVSLADGSYTVRPASGHGVAFSPAVITVSPSATTFTFTGISISAGPANSRTARYIVNRVRNLVLEKDSQSPYRDGFAADASFDDSSPSILEAINAFQRKLSKTGYYKCYFDLTLTPRTSGDEANNEYTFNADIHRVLSVVLFDLSERAFPLLEANLEAMDLNRSYWRSRSSGRPTEYYTYGNVIGFNIPPDLAYTVQALANTVAPDLVLETDVPDKLPTYFHEALAFGGALEIANSQVENEAAIKRIPYFEAQVKEYMDELQRISSTRPINSVQNIASSNPANRIQQRRY